jgi:hypothetical protein
MIDVGQLDRIAGDRLHLLRQRFDLGAISLVSRGHGQRQQVAQRIDRDVHLRSLAALGSVMPAWAPDSGVDCSVRLLRLTAVGWPSVLVRPFSD